MALATRCPHCHTTFRVASDQLKLRGGMVRCGACQQVFDGGAHLTELPARPAAAAPATSTTPAAPSSGAGTASASQSPVSESPVSQGPVTPSSAAAPETAPAPAPDGPVDFDDVPVYTLDFGSTFDPLGILPRAAPAAREPVPMPVPANDAGADVPVQAPQDSSPPHGDVLAGAVAATATAADMHYQAAAGVDAPAEAAQHLPPAVTPPHGDVLAHAVDAIVLADAVAATVADTDEQPASGADALAEAEQDLSQDATPPHGDMLAHAVDAVAPADAQTPAADSVTEAPQDPSAPHGDAMGHALAAASSGTDTTAPAPDFTPAAPSRAATPPSFVPSFVPPGRVEPRLEADAASGAPAEPVPGLEPEPALPQPLPDWTEPDPLPAPPAQAAPAYTAPGRIEPSFNLPVDEELVAQPVRDYASQPEPEPNPAPGPAHAMPFEPAPQDTPGGRPFDGMTAGLPLRASAAGGLAAGDTAEPAMPPGPASRSARAKAVDARSRRSRLTPTRIEAPKLRVPESDEPEFVKRSRKQEQSGRTRRILMAVGAVALLLVLAAQLVLNFRNVLAARYPAGRPALGAACALLGCRVELPAQIDNLAIETGELTTLGPDTYSLITLLRNQGSLVQAWPSIELELTDAADKPVLRRVLAPADYLPQGTSSAAGFGARSEQAIRLHFALTELKPSGYHIAVFYP